MKIVDKICVDFVEVLFFKEVVLGGGGVVVLVGVIGMVLGSMVCNFIIGKKKYVEYEESVKEILSKVGKLEKDLLKMIDDDVECFLLLLKVYGFFKEIEEEKRIKVEIMEKVLKVVCEVLLNIVRVCYEVIKLYEDLVDKGLRFVISDVGVGV